MLSKAKNISYRDKTIALFKLSYSNIVRMTNRRMELAVVSLYSLLIKNLFYIKLVFDLLKITKFNISKHLCGYFLKSNFTL
jgi:hypothetical protein